MIEYHTYTAKDVREWIENGAKNGLSEQVISRTRAYAFLNNPYVTDESVLAVSATDGEKVVGFTAGFPDELVRPKCKCIVASTLYVLPEYTGDFIGFELIKRIKESYPDYDLIGSDETKSAALIDKLLGNKIEEFSRNRFDINRKIRVHSFRSFGSYLLEPFRRRRQLRNIERQIQSIGSDMKVEYISMIDNEAYRFIESHSENDAFLRSQNSLNWVLRFPLSISAPSQHRLIPQNAFGAQVSESTNSGVKVYYKEQLVGVYMHGKRREDAKILMLYVDENYAQQVYAIMMEHLMAMHPKKLYSQYEGFNEFMLTNRLSLYHAVDKYYYTHPVSLPCSTSQQLQGAEGDMFA